MTDSNHIFNPDLFRAQFPALQRRQNGRPVAYLDGPGGTQVPGSVIEAMSRVLAQGVSNLGGPFSSSVYAEEITAQARLAMRDLLNARSTQEIVFGQNMTSLTFAVSRAIGRTWQPGDEIILTRLDHDANISPWLLSAEERGVKVHWLDFDPTDGTLNLRALPEMLNSKTRLLAITYASNAIGTINDIKKATQSAHAAGALVYVDSVHYAPHGLIDVQDLDCDFLACSAYKFFGPHQGILFGKYELLDHLTAYKVRPAPAKPAGKWETGTQSFESLAGTTAAVNYIASIGGEQGTRRERLVGAYGAIKAHEQELSERFLRGATLVPGLQVFGITDIESLDGRVPTFAVRLEGYTAEEVAARLGQQGMFVWHGHYYAVAVMERLGLLDQGGLVRIGFVHYNTAAEVDGVLRALGQLAAESR